MKGRTLRKMVLLATMLALAALMTAATAAMADDNDDVLFVFGDNDCDRNDNCDFFDNNDCDFIRNDLFGIRGNDDCGFNNFNDFLGNNDGGFLSSDVEQESESGDVSLGFDVSNTGRYASQCTPATQFGNTGNFQNASSFVQYAGELDDFEPEGIDVSFGGSQDVDCSNTIQQSSAASSN